MHFARSQLQARRASFPSCTSLHLQARTHWPHALPSQRVRRNRIRVARLHTVPCINLLYSEPLPRVRSCQFLTIPNDLCGLVGWTVGKER